MRRTFKSEALTTQPLTKNPFAIFEIIVEARKIRKNSLDPLVIASATRIEQFADEMMQVVLGSVELVEISDEVLSEICELLSVKAQ